MGPKPAGSNTIDSSANGWPQADRLAAVDAESDFTVTEILARYWRFAEQHYRKDGQPTQEVINIRYALRPVKELYGTYAGT